MFICQQCNAEFYKNCKRGPDYIPKFCSVECRQKSKAAIIRKCANPLCEEMTRAKYCGHPCAASCTNKGRKHSDETKEKISNTIKKCPTGWAKNSSAAKLAAKKSAASIKQRGYQRKREQELILSICPECKVTFSFKSYNKKKYCSRNCSNKNAYHPNSTRVHRCIYNGHKLDSGAEKLFAVLLDDNNITWTKNTEQFFSFIDSKGKSRKYYPDFYLPDYDFWVEIKGKRYVREDDDLRRAAVGDNIELIMSHQMRLPRCIRSGAEELRHPTYE